MQKKFRRVLPNQKKVVLLQSQNERNGARGKREVLGSSLKEWNDVANGSKQTFERFASDKVGTDKKEKKLIRMESLILAQDERWRQA